MDVRDSLYSVDQLRELDRRAIEQSGITGIDLMGRAGEALLRVLDTRFPRARRVALVCGAGNNGGDGFVLARLLTARGFAPAVFALGDFGESSVDATAARVHAEEVGIVMQPFTQTRLADAEVIVDALFGIGLRRAVQGEWRAAIDAINAAGMPVVSVDVPSGLNAETGAVMGAAVRAHVTVSFIGLKTGLFTGAGRDYAGEIILDDLDVPAEIYEDMLPVARRLGEAALRGKLVRRAQDANKGDFGHVLVVGGAQGMSGAAVLCGEAAYRAGAGLVTLATQTGATNARAELMTVRVRGAPALKPLLARATVVAVGPGFSQMPWSSALWQALRKTEQPLVVDADALNLLAAKNMKRPDWILTPHPGEAARLLGSTVAAVQRDRVAAAKALVKRFGGVCVLKGSGTVITDGRGPVWVCDRGNPGMAKGGAGDVLTGAIAALRAQGLGALDAACLGVWAHATAGDAAAQTIGETALLAGEIGAHIGRQLDKLRA
jgi:NAD(P)H-hydrate epimerase